MDPLTSITTDIARKIAQDQDDLIRRLAHARLKFPASDAVLIPRLRWEIHPDKAEKMLLLDGEPLALLWPPACETTTCDATGRNEMKWTMAYLAF